MGRINYDAGNPTWSKVTRKDGTEQWKCTLRYYVDGKRTSRSKRFSAEESARLTTDNKKKNALRRWIAELNDEQDELEKEEAERKRAEDEAKAVAALPGAHTTVGDYISQFIDDLAASGHIEKSTEHSYRRFNKIISGAFPGVKLCDLTTTMVQKWENGLVADGYSPSTITKYHRLLSMTCKHAVNTDVLQKNPCSAVKPPKQQAPSPNALDREGFARLAVTLDMMEPSQVVTAAYIAMFTGMRNGEVCGLRWREYDVESMTINVVEAIGAAGGNTYSKAPKTRASKRSIPVHPKLAAMLERRRIAMERELQIAHMKMNQREFGELYIVGYADGRFMNPTMLTRAWRALADSLGIIGTQGKPLVFHGLRHAFATVTIAAGADVRAVAANLGHSNVAQTLNQYADADAQAKKRTVGLIGEAIIEQGKVKPYAMDALPE